MKKSTFKKVLCIVLMSLMVLSLVACGGGRDTDTESEGPSTATVVYDTQGGTLPAGKEDTVEYDVGKKLLLLPTPTKEGYEFAGWTLNGEAVATPFIVEEDVVFTATWTKVGGGDNTGTSTNTNDGSSDVTSDTETEDNRPKVTISLVLNGGKLADDEADEFEAVVGELIGKLPTPTRAGYTFDGWFEDGNEKWEIDKKSEVEAYDMELHALWTAKGEIVTVEFFLNADETLEEGAAVYFEMVAGEMVGSFVDKLPNATKSGNKFVGWQDENGVRVSLTTRINSDIRLSPVWTRVILCHDGTENHQWNAWQEYSQATCTTPAQEQRICNVCGGSEYNITQEATGHKYGNFALSITEEGISRSRTCVECDDKDASPLNNIAYGSFQVPVVDGELWSEAEPGANLIDGDYEMNNKKSFAGKGTGAITVTVNAKEATYVDIIALTGYGSASYTIVVTDDKGVEHDLGLGSFGSGTGATKPFDVNMTITKIVINMPSCSIGSDYWVELSVLVVPKD